MTTNTERLMELAGLPLDYYQSGPEECAHCGKAVEYLYERDMCDECVDALMVDWRQELAEAAVEALLEI